MASSSDPTFLPVFCGDKAYDSRSQKILTAVRSAGYSLTDQIPFSQKSQGRFVFNYIPWLWSQVEQIRDNKPSFLYCLDIFSIPCAFLTGVPFFFDAREINSHVHAFKSRPALRLIWGYFERWAFRHATGISTVNTSLYNWFSANYGRKTHILLNVPVYLPDPAKRPDRQMFNLPEKSFVWVYQGGIQSGRGVEFLLDWITGRPENEFLLLIGPVSPDMKSNFQSTKQQEKIRLAGSFPQSELLSVTSLGDAGLMLIDTSTTSYRLSLPNKFFEYLAAGLPVISSDLPEVKHYMEIWKCGLVIESPTALSEAADRLLSQYPQFKQAVSESKTHIIPTKVVQELSVWINDQLTSGTEPIV